MAAFLFFKISIFTFRRSISLMQSARALASIKSNIYTQEIRQVIKKSKLSHRYYHIASIEQFKFHMSKI